MKQTQFWLLLLIMGLGLMNQAVGQRIQLQGTVVDTAGSPLFGATVVLLQAEDSVLASFNLTNSKGKFVLKNIKPGDYLFRINFIGYAKYSKAMTLTEAESLIEMPAIVLGPQVFNADEVTIEAEVSPIMSTQDTLEYNAGSFKTKPNAVVEDLLRKLPGVEVDRNGNIKAQGENVGKVLVDGQEFFGDDPKIATKNLPADVVDKVQVFDKKSDLEEFSGIDDGQRNVALNLKLKEDKKIGLFGNVRGGYGTQDRYDGKAMINRFNKKNQLSLLGMLNNTNQQGFSFEEYINFMGGLQSMMTGGGPGEFRINIDGGETGLPIDQGIGTGFTDTGAGGLNFNRKFNKNTRLSSSYFFNRIENRSRREAFRDNFLGDAQFRTEEEGDRTNRNTGHRLNLNLRHQIDSMSKLIVRANANYNESFSQNSGISRNLNESGALENRNSRDNLGQGSALSASTDLTYQRRFRKAGRLLVGSLNLSGNQDDQDLDLFSINQFLPNDPLGFADTIRQNQLQENNQLSYRASLSYTEPLGKKRYLTFSAIHSDLTNEVRRDVVDLEGNTEVPNEALSNHFRRGYLFDVAGLRFRINQKKYNFSIGINAQRSLLDGELISLDTSIRQDFLNFLPQLQFRYELGTGSNFNLFYRTSVREPSIQQLQPIVDNSNPLNIYVGNPELRPEYNHNLNLRYMYFSSFSFVSFMANVNATYTENKITNAKTIDDLFRQSITPINVENDVQIVSSFNYGMPIRPLGVRVNLDANLVYGRSLLFVNELENTVERLIGQYEFTIENRKKDVVDLLLGVSLTSNQTQYSVSEELDQSFLNQTWFADLRLNLFDKWALSTVFDYNIYGGDAFNEQTTIPLWQASISRFILKNKRGELKLSAYDLLNQNVGFNRTSNFNYLQEERIQSLARYFLLSFTLNLSKFGAKRPSGGIEINMNRRR
ncbi:MAG: outer membrane beta-barrel family protein [Bacteroidota bacterium]